MNIFDSIESFVARIRIYSEIPPTPAVAAIIINMTVEILSVLSLATKQVNWGLFSKSVLPTIVHIQICRRELVRD
jgi:hypothetical protein